MAIFQSELGNESSEALRRHPYQSKACSILHFGPAALYRDRAILDDDLDALADEGFDLVRLRARRWAKDARLLHDDLKEALSLPDYYGGNLDALADCRGSGDMRSISDEAGLVIVIEDAQTVRSEWLTGLVDVFVHASRFRQIFGETLLVLIQSDDPDYRLDGLGATSAYWNRRESLRSKRAPE